MYVDVHLNAEPLWDDILGANETRELLRIEKPTWKQFDQGLCLAMNEAEGRWSRGETLEKTEWVRLTLDVSADKWMLLSPREGLLLSQTPDGLKLTRVRKAG